MLHFCGSDGLIMPNENPRQRQLTGAATNLSARHWTFAGKPSAFRTTRLLTIECVLNAHVEAVAVAVVSLRLRTESVRDTQRSVLR